MIDRFSCPKCGRSLEKSGEAEYEDTTFPVFQCDECIVATTLYGEPVELPLTFAVDAKGQPFDPATDDGRLIL
jgi:hypothetical protein